MEKIRYEINVFGITVKYRIRAILKKIMWVFRRYLSELAFWVIGFVKNWNPEYYDENVVHLYQSVRKKKAFTFKEKIMSMGKGQRNVKVLMIETEKNIIKIELTPEKYPKIFGNKGKK